jgi:hypothetical protein
VIYNHQKEKVHIPPKHYRTENVCQQKNPQITLKYWVDVSIAGSPFKTEKSEPARSTSVPTCGYCKKKGHILSDCYILKRRRFSVLKGLPAVESECLLVTMLKSLFEVVEYKDLL